MQELIRQIKERRFERVYLLYGEEQFLKLRWRDRLVRALLPDENSMNLNIYSGSGIDEAAVIDQAETLPFFADRRVIRLDYTGLFAKAAEKLPAYLASLPEHVCLIFTEDSVDKRSRMYKAVLANGHCAEFAEQSRSALGKWVLQMLGAEGLRIRPADLELFLDRTGPDMSLISLETDKLIHYCAGRGEVTGEDILALTENRLEDRIFDMASAVSAGRRTEAMKLYADLVGLSVPPARILSILARQFNQLLVIREMEAEGLPADTIAGKLGTRAFVVKKNRGLAARFSREALREAVAVLVRNEEAFKTGQLTDALAVELSIIALSGKSGSQTA